MESKATDDSNEPFRLDAERSSKRERGRAPLTPECIEQIRARIRERAYDSDAVLEATARGILGSEDVQAGKSE